LGGEKQSKKKKARRFLPSAAPNYTHRRKGVFNVRSIVDLRVGGNVRSRTITRRKRSTKNDKKRKKPPRACMLFGAVHVLRFRLLLVNKIRPVQPRWHVRSPVWSFKDLLSG